jgi:putative endonuclease
MDRVTQRLWRGVEGPRRRLFIHTVRSFSTTKARHGFGCECLLYIEGYEDIRTAIAREKQLKGWRRAKKLKLIRSIHPEFKDLAQTWGWKMITVHEKI